MARLEVLLRERAGYVNRNLPDRVAQVDALIAALDPSAVPAEVEVAVSAPAAVEHAVKRAPKGRR